ncbi:MAG TPA: hypothetical protein VFJ11_01500 [Gaiellaceae bacterium]|nr:hypothetical protein [Gaiellaceae bacterium]
MSVVASPRRRRRLAWLGGFLVVAVAIVFLVTLFPNTSGFGPQHFSNTPVQRVQVEKQVPVTRERRAAVNELFDRFVPAAVERKDPGAAYDLVTAQGRSGLTREDWRNGQLPVYAYDARGTTFHGWIVEGSYAKEMDLELDLQPRSPKDGPVAYAVTVKQVGGRWLIDSIYPRTSYAPTSPAARGKEPAGQQPDASIPQAKTGVAWLLIAGLVVLILGAPAVFFFTQWRSGRRHRSRFAD